MIFKNNRKFKSKVAKLLVGLILVSQVVVSGTSLPTFAAIGDSKGYIMVADETVTDPDAVFGKVFTNPTLIDNWSQYVYAGFPDSGARPARPNTMNFDDNFTYETGINAQGIKYFKVSTKPYWAEMYDSATSEIHKHYISSPPVYTFYNPKLYIDSDSLVLDTANTDYSIEDNAPDSFNQIATHVNYSYTETDVFKPKFNISKGDSWENSASTGISTSVGIEQSFSLNLPVTSQTTVRAQFDKSESWSTSVGNNITVDYGVEQDINVPPRTTVDCTITYTNEKGITTYTGKAYVVYDLKVTMADNTVASHTKYDSCSSRPDQPDIFGPSLPELDANPQRLDYQYNTTITEHGNIIKSWPYLMLELGFDKDGNDNPNNHALTDLNYHYQNRDNGSLGLVDWKTAQMVDYLARSVSADNTWTACLENLLGVKYGADVSGELTAHNIARYKCVKQETPID